MDDRLAMGTTVSGLLFDGLEHTPWVAATMAVTERGVQITVPHMHGDDQFEMVAKWLDTNDGTTNLILESIDSTISLFGLRISSRRTDIPRNIAEGQLLATDTVMMRRNGDIGDPLLVEEIRSDIDGLTDWSRLQSISSESTSHGDGSERRYRETFTIEQVDGLEWSQCDARMRIATTWESRYGRGLKVEDRATLISSFPTPRPIADHLQEQRKFANLLGVVFGTRISFRRHEVRDSRFSDREGSQNPYVELVSGGTFHDFQNERPSRRDLLRPLFYMSHLQPMHLQDWADNHDRIARALHPYLEVLRTPSGALENRAIDAAMSLEAIGNSLERVEGEECTYRNGQHRTMATWVLRCILNTNPAPTQDAFDSHVLFARAIAKNYNMIKHPGNAQFPDPLHTYILSDLSASIARHNIVKLYLGNDVFTNIDQDGPYHDASGTLHAFDLVIAGDGSISIREE